MVFVIASFVNSLGSAFMWPLTTLYVFSFFERSAADAGNVLLLQALASIIGQLLGGSLFHKIGVRTLVVISLLLTSVAQFSLMWTDHFLTYAIIMAFVGFFNALSMPAIQAFIGFRWADRRREMYNIAYVGNNIGVAVGTACSGIIASYSYHLTFLLNGMTSFVFGIFFYIFMSKINFNLSNAEKQAHQSKGSKPTGTLQLLGSYRLYLFMALGSMFIWFGNSIWGTGISTFLDEQGLKPFAYSVLWTINGVLIFAGQPLLRWMNQIMTRTLTSQLTGSAVFYFLGFVLILCNQTYPAIVIAMLLITIGEMLISPTIPAFISERAGKHSPFYLGVVGAISSVGRLLGPSIIGYMYVAGSIHYAAWVAVIGGALSVTFFMIHASFHRNHEQFSVGNDRSF